ncbi:MAG: ribonuclease J [Pseudomonadota bacterium]
MAEQDLVFLPLGGSGEIGMNMNLYGLGHGEARQWLMIDCGVMFGDHRSPGIDLICPDIDYILGYKDNIAGLVLTHGHEDHIGAVALLAPLLGCPIYATAFTAALIRRKFDDRNEDMSALTILEMGERFQIGDFDLELVTLTHSIPEPSGVIIRTPLGTVLHTGDWKIDTDPALGPRTDAAKLTQLGDDGLLAMICDSTNVLSKGESGSETTVREHLKRVIADQRGRVAVTTFASNVGRVVSICEAARAVDRSVCLLGRSMLKLVDAAREAGILPDGLTFVSPEEAGFIPREHVLYLCTGSQGEPRAALARIARDDHRDLVLSTGDTVIFSSKIIPGNERDIFNLQNELVDLGIHIITEKDEPIHVSGHPCQDELAQMYQWARPRYGIPVHGEARHLEAHAQFALEHGAEQSISPRNGDLIRLAPGPLKRLDAVPAGRMTLDGDLLMPMGARPVRERKKLTWAGACVASLVFHKNSTLAAVPGIALFGAPDEGDEGMKLHPEIIEEITACIQDMAPKSRLDDDAVTMVTKRAIRDVTTDLWGKRPVIDVLIHRIKS